MSSFRALETDEQAADRMSVDRACKAKKRVLETEEEAFERKSHDRACKAKKRALETEEEAFERKSHDRASKGNNKYDVISYIHYVINNTLKPQSHA